MPYYDDLDRSKRTSWGYGKRWAWEFDEDEPHPQLEFMYGHFPDHIKRRSDIYLRWLAENGIDPEEAEKHQTATTSSSPQPPSDRLPSPPAPTATTSSSPKPPSDRPKPKCLLQPKPPLDRPPSPKPAQQVTPVPPTTPATTCVDCPRCGYAISVPATPKPTRLSRLIALHQQRRMEKQVQEDKNV